MKIRSTFAALAAFFLTVLPAAAQVPPNNHFASSQLISGGTGAVIGSTINATVENGEPGFGVPSVWFTWKAPFSGYVRFDAGTSNFDAGVLAYTGDTLATLTPADDGSGNSETTFAVQLDVVYRIQVAAYSDPDALLLTWAPTNAPPPPPNPPANDNFASAQTIAGATGTTTGTNTNSTDEVDEAGPGNRSVWYNWTAPFTGFVRFDTFGSNYDTRLSARTGTNVAALTQLAENDDTAGSFQSRIDFAVTNGTIYRIRVSGFNGSQGNITLNWSQTPPGPGALSFTGNADVQETAGTATLTVVRIPATGAVAVTYSTQDFDALAGQDYTTTTGTLNFADGETSKTFTVPILNDSTPENDEAFEVSLSSPTNGATLGDDDVFVIIRNDEFPANDNFANAQTLPGASGTAAGNNAGATTEDAEPIFGAHSIWYRWTPAQDGVAVLDTAGSARRLAIRVYLGTALDGLVLVAENFDDFNGGATQAVFAVAANTTYTIVLATTSLETGATTLNYVLNNGSYVELSEQGVFHEVRENAGNATLTLTRVGRLNSAASVRLTATDATATAGTDYTAFDQVVTLPADQASVAVNIPLTADSDPEENEYFFVTLSDPTGNAELGRGVAKRVVINDQQDNPTNDNFAAAQAVAGAFGAVDATNAGASREVGEPTHHAPGNRSVWFTYTAPGNGSATFRAHASNFRTLLAAYTGASLGTLTKLGEDSDDSDDFAAVVSIPVATGAVVRLAVDTSSFRDDDDTDDTDDLDNGELGSPFAFYWNTTLPGTVGFTAATYTGTEGQPSAAITLSRAGGSDGRVSVQLGIAGLGGSPLAAGTDYFLASSEVVFEPGQTMKTVSLALLNDQVFEAPKQAQLSLFSPAGGAFLGTTSATLTINDDDPYQPTAQKFAALVKPLVPGLENTGAINLTTNAAGSFSGTLALGGQVFKFKGEFDDAGQAAVNVGGVTLALQLSEDGRYLEGTVTRGATIVASFNGRTSPFNEKTNSAPQAGAYTLVLRDANLGIGPLLPKGDGAVTFTVAGDGSVKLTGTLGDGAKFSAASAMSADGVLPVFASLYKKIGALSGELRFRLVAGASHADGTFTHLRPAGVAKPAGFPDGFTAFPGATASRYVFTKGAPVVFAPAGAGAIGFGEGGLAGALSQDITVSTKNKVASTGTVQVPVTMKLKTKTGTFSGTFTPTGATKPVKFNGVVFQIDDTGGGSFLGTTGSGFVRLVED